LEVSGTQIFTSQIERFFFIQIGRLDVKGNATNAIDMTFVHKILCSAP